MKEELKDRKILLGVTGSIAAYKSAYLARELVKKGAEVRVIMTPSAAQFITPLTFANLTKNPVAVEMFDETAQRGGAWHIHLANWCDVMLIAPITCSTLGKLANGICDTALVTVATALPRNKHLILAPAMDTEMWLHPATQRNIEILRSYHADIIPPAEGELSSGLTGPGRFPETDEITKTIESILAGSAENKAQDDNTIEVIVEKKKPKEEDIQINTINDAVDKDEWSADLELSKLKDEVSGKEKSFLRGKKILITAGPTHEKIDDVRFIGNHSSGKMGFALAETAFDLGGEVTLIAGPVNLQTPEGAIRLNVKTAAEMHEAVISQYEDSDIIIMAAAVADFTAEDAVSGKIKKDSQENGLMLKLKPTIDILSELGRKKKNKQILIGFALESENELNYGRQKLEKKNCDMIVVNSAIKPRSGFGGDDNTITIITKDGKEQTFPPMPKSECAIAIFNAVRTIMDTVQSK
jgi:phosphopantothenoylcysteine decarboxylase / phosphopantothenate---cysteine ligase